MQSQGHLVHTETAAYHLARERLQMVEERIASLLDCDIPLVREMSSYVHGNGGKRLRPALVVLCARLCGYQGDRDVDLGVVVEFIHSASLVHDDIVDGAEARRGRSCSHRVWGNQKTVLLGDFLYARALALSVALGKLRIVEVLTQATSRLVEGEILDVMHNGNAQLDLAGYMNIIDRKTASLFAGCAQAAAVLAGVSREQEAALAGFGHDVGLAFQLIDDLLDYDADPERLGKEPGTDLREGKLTYPLIHLLAHASASERELVLSCLGNPARTAAHLPDVVSTLRSNGSFAATRQEAERYAEQARTALSILPANEIREALEELPEFIVTRRQ